jgi:hypothetical protein
VDGGAAAGGPLAHPVIKAIIAAMASSIRNRGRRKKRLTSNESKQEWIKNADASKVSPGE